MGLDIPEWMEGKSLINQELLQRPIIGVAARKIVTENQEGGLEIDPDLVAPPFYQFGYISVIYCNQWYQMDLNKLEFTSGEIEGYYSTCSDADTISEQEAFATMIDHLAGNGFDTSVLTETPINLTQSK